MGRVQLITAAASLLVAGLLGGCGGAAEEPPAGAATARLGSARFVHPAGWTTYKGRTADGTTAITVAAPAAPEGPPKVLVRLAERAGDAGTMRDGLTGVRLTHKMNGHRIRADRDVEVPGAEQAHRVDTEYELELLPVTSTSTPTPPPVEITVDPEGKVVGPAPPAVPTPAGRDVSMRTVEVNALTAGGRIVTFVVTTPAAQYGAADVERIVGSLSVDG